MRTSSSGLLLLLVAILGLVGFLTGNLDRWMGWLFDPSKPALSGTPAAAAPAAAKPTVAPASSTASLVSIGGTTTRQTA